MAFYGQVKKLRNVTIGNIEAVGASRIGCASSRLPGHPMENLCLDHIRLRFEGGGTRQDVRWPIPENPGGYPEYNMLGRLPAYGFYCRHIHNLKLQNLETGFEQVEERPAPVFEDVEDLEIAGGRFAGAPEGGEPSVRLSGVKGAFVPGPVASLP